jgi:hypothetical protein
MIDNRYNFIRYNGLSKAMLDSMPDDYFNNAFVVIDEAHNFISQATHPKTLKHKLYIKLLNARNTKFILLTGTPIINDPFELAYSLNLVRGPLTRFEYALPGSDVPTNEKVRDELKKAGLDSIVDYIHVFQDKRKIELTFTPRGMEFASDARVELQRSARPINKDESTPLTRVSQVLQSAFNAEVPPKVFNNEAAYPMDRKQFYKMFVDESGENPTLINQDLFMRRAIGLVSFYKTNDINIFPEKLKTEIHKIPLSDYQFEKYVDYRTRERALMKQTVINPLKDTNSVYRAFTRMAGNFVFPKDIPRRFPSDVRRLRKAEIDTEFEVEDTLEYSDTANDKGKKLADKKLDDAEYKAYANALLPALTKEAHVYLNPNELKSMYSPKMAALLKHMSLSEGKSLIYSQFSSLEGLGVLKLVLKQNGWEEIELESVGTEWRIKNAAAVLDPKYAKKRFISFHQNRDITNVLMNIINGNLEIVPSNVRQQLASAGYKTREDNFRGQWATALLISQSGAEGINLKHIRNVFILEPFWNQVRIDQVIGRAIRTCSHADLPPDERNVRVVMYVSTFTKDQKDRDMSISRQDKGYTSDQYILMMSLNKNAIINGFLNMLIRASVDCLNNSQRSKIVKDYGMSCYAYPVNAPLEDHGFTPSYKFDYQNVDSVSQRLIKTTSVQGKVVQVNGKKYIRLLDPVLQKEGADELYDYNAYTNAGVLVRATI